MIENNAPEFTQPNEQIFNTIMEPKMKLRFDNAFVESIEGDYKTKEGLNISYKYMVGIAQKIWEIET